MSQRIGPSLRRSKAWDPTKGQNSMGLEEFGLRHKGLSGNNLRSRWEAATSEEGGRKFHAAHPDLAGDIASGKIKIMPEAVPGAAPNTPAGTGGSADRDVRVSPAAGGGQLGPPDAPPVQGRDDAADLVRAAREGMGLTRYTEPSKGTKYKDFVQQSGGKSTAALAGVFRGATGGKITAKMRRAMEAAAANSKKKA